jgi:hypothetical protein
MSTRYSAELEFTRQLAKVSLWFRTLAPETFQDRAEFLWARFLRAALRFCVSGQAHARVAPVLSGTHI